MALKPEILSNQTKIEVIQNLTEKIRVFYVFPEMADQICACLQKHLQSGEYTDIIESDFFAYALTQHIQEASHDEHLWVRWHPEILPEDEGPLRLNPEWQETRKLEADLDNYGLYKVERLAGNVGYLDFHYLHRPAWAGEAISAAMSLVANTLALILDLRNCSGGYPAMIALLCSYLFAEEPIHLTSITWRDDNFTQQYWTHPYVPGRRYLDKPVYVLTSKVTFSAGEELAHILQSRKRASLLGEKTDGGANPGASYRLHPHFEGFIPIGCSIDPLTGTNREGIGVSPDILLPKEQAFRAAYHRALESILSDLDGSTNAPFKHLVDEVKAALDQLDKG